MTDRRTDDAQPHDEGDGQLAPAETGAGAATTATRPGDEYHSELPPHTFDNLAAALPDSLGAPLGSPGLTRSAVLRTSAADGSARGATRSDVSAPGTTHPGTHTIEIVTPQRAREVAAPLGVSGTAAAALSLSTGPTNAATASRRDRSRADALAPESASMLTSDRLLEVNRKTRRPPNGSWNRFVYRASFHLINLGDSAAVRAHQAMDERIRKQFEGGARFVPILTRKGGVGKTTVTALLGMAMADAREDRIIAVDANPDRGTLSERVSKQTRSTVRDVVTKAASIGGFTDFSVLVSRDETRLDILASDTDPLLSEAFDENDYNVVADLAARFYSIVLTDCGTGIVHSVMRATLQRADSIVIVSGGSVDEARLASETLTWLEANGYGELVRNAIVALNTATQGTNLVKLEEIESHFRSRVREIVRIPYDPQLAAGSVVSFKDLKPITRLAARTLAALVVEGLPAERRV
ncbi:MinD/ParA family protein [Cryobacterium sp. SO1]|uniref:MinD/ParA family ATP-binding protein n=1 Tax=Cryobacterium sp. SO1 TaxID=1897061 RepID=UPI0010E40A5F|nr:MinD/ParA family protein [Cryobacterium sp. SO1]RZI34022.1 ESX-1 secretion-associated protein EspI [Cryobacterium sp. SO1]